MLPIGIQFVHSLEDHEHVVCNSKDLQHIHKQELDCSFCHVIINNSAVLTEIYTSDNYHFISSEIPVFYSNENDGISIYYKPSRAPPIFIA
ncbi:hypothetical protein LPB138_04585 [Urechidicola croceus]|uniref:Uncharacterized protein n=1 Tax=Urechidicola croceus TaxID=1850246 RepID=A0A1D8P5X9_9FLAO|nr:hypothetical protein LPB138_04585 [Urechidicola croceus]